VNRHHGETASSGAPQTSGLKHHVADLGKLEGGCWLPHDEGEPLFDEPWQAQVFALAVQLHEAGLFTWPEWSELLGHEITKAQQAGDPDLGDTYYRHWLNTLEHMLRVKGVALNGELESLQQRWDAAARATPHGQPITLEPLESSQAAASSLKLLPTALRKHE